AFAKLGLLANAEAQLKREEFDVIAVPGSVGNPDDANARSTLRSIGSAVSTTWSTMLEYRRPPPRFRRRTSSAWVRISGAKFSPSTWSDRSAAPAPPHRT